MTSTKPTPLFVAGLGVLAALPLMALHPLFRTHAAEMALSIGSDTLEYLLYAIGFFLVFWVVLGPLKLFRRIARHRWPKGSQVLRETVFSVTTQIVFLAVALWTEFLPASMEANMYSDIGEHGWAYYGLTVFLAFLAHDTYFYWTHRAMHHPWLFERVHRVHHESVDPTPFTTYSFHPLEAVIEGLGGLALIPVFMLMPWHPSVFVVWGVGQIVFNSIGHLGFEVYPRFWLKLPVLNWKTPGLHHYMHHQRVGGNYGLYFRFWDKLCGTEFKDFEVRYERLFAQPTRTRQASAPVEPLP